MKYVKQFRQETVREEDPVIFDRKINEVYGRAGKGGKDPVVDFIAGLGLCASIRYFVNEQIPEDAKDEFELKHFCAQYPEWRELYFLAKSQTLGEEADPTGFYASVMADCQANMDLIKNVSFNVDKSIGPYIFIHVTRGDSFDKLLACDGIPCCRESFYIFLRKFYYQLSIEKG